jgi:hypothetical protein
MALGAEILALAALTYAFRVAGHVGRLGELINTLKDVRGGRRLYLGRDLTVRNPIRSGAATFWRSGTVPQLVESAWRCGLHRSQEALCRAGIESNASHSRVPLPVRRIGPKPSRQKFLRQAKYLPPTIQKVLFRSGFDLRLRSFAAAALP